MRNQLRSARGLGAAWLRWASARVRCGRHGPPEFLGRWRRKKGEGEPQREARGSDVGDAAALGARAGGLARTSSPLMRKLRAPWPPQLIFRAPRGPSPPSFRGPTSERPRAATGPEARPRPPAASSTLGARRRAPPALRRTWRVGLLRRPRAVESV